MLFAEVVLPLPLYSSFTYSIPEGMEGVVTGSRVLVQFGRRKFYTGIVASVHPDAPEGYSVKPISLLLDPTPIVRFPQLRLWQWIADYYLCSPGEVYKAAIPTGLKPESTTFLSLSPDCDLLEASASLKEEEARILQLVSSEKRLSISDIESRTEITNATSYIRPLLEQGVLEVAEAVVEKYRPKTVRMVRLSLRPGDHDGVHRLLDLTNRSTRQQNALMAYLDMSGFLSTRTEPKEVERDALMQRAGITPGILKAMVDKEIFEVYKKSVNRFQDFDGDTCPIPPLTEIQRDAFDAIAEGFRTKEVMLLHGVTGSGKTEIYAHLIDRVLNAGRQVLFLVPEISLTTQLTDRLRRLFGDRLLVYHSKFSDNERVDVWRRVLDSHDPLLILGARSAVFLPFHHLGLVIVDEEHESSYKQYDPAPRYNARDTAMVLASMHGAKTLLGSATPAVDTYYKALNGKYGLVTLSERFEGAALPTVEIIDMKDQRKRKLSDGILSQPLRLATEQAMHDGKQALMFQNRRGFAPFVVCRNCGWTPRCTNCDVALVYHKHSDLLRCHYCGFSMPLPPLCPACQENSVEVYGYGTERIAEEVHRRFEGYRVGRMDLDSTRNKDAFQEIIEDFSCHNMDILVGTQMITKGLDFGDVTVVGVLNADSLLNFPDFRANERAFNMLEQVAGRAGRRSDAGYVFIQTTDPGNAVLAHVAAHDYKAFYEMEIQSRERLLYPPFSRIINIFLKNKNSTDAEAAAHLFANALRATFGPRVLGPEKPFVSRVATWYLQCIMLKIESSASMSKVKRILRTIYESLARDPRIKSSVIYYDVDPA
ncbi:MAG: primosomal protein N' [Muribaculaceae bacterium]|nr:primosomal protein N' [Muribaculaceae bacterium]MDE7080268.1 primosomal protein N' [Muribaculaceae bacterium]